MTRAVVAAVLVVVAVAVADALRAVGDEPRGTARNDAVMAVRSPGSVPAAGGRVELIRSTRSGFRPAGDFLQTHVLQSGHVVLTPAQIARAFPAQLGGPVDIKDVALAPDGTLVVAVYRFPPDHPARAAIEFWRKRRLVGAFTLAPGMLRGGLGFTRDGKLVATFSADGRRATLFDRRGRALADVPL